MNQLIIDAIRNRRVLRLDYHGYHRVVEPHCYGANTAGHESLRCYQTAGGSQSGEKPDWKMLLLSEMHQLSDTGQTFATPRPGYKQGDKGMTTIYAQL